MNKDMSEKLLSKRTRRVNFFCGVGGGGGNKGVKFGEDWVSFGDGGV